MVKRTAGLGSISFHIRPSGTDFDIIKVKRIYPWYSSDFIYDLSLNIICVRADSFTYGLPYIKPPIYVYTMGCDNKINSYYSQYNEISKKHNDRDKIIKNIVSRMEFMVSNP